MSSPTSTRRPNARLRNLIPPIAMVRSSLTSHPFQWSQRPRVKVAGFQKARQGRHVTPHFGQAIRRFLGPRRPIRIIRFACIQGLLDTSGMPHQIFFGDRLLCLRVGKKALAVLQPRHSWIQAIKRPIKVPKQRHMTHHLTGCVNFAAQAALRQLPGELGCPLQNVARTRQSRRHRTDHEAFS